MDLVLWSSRVCLQLCLVGGSRVNMSQNIRIMDSWPRKYKNMCRHLYLFMEQTISIICPFSTSTVCLGINRLCLDMRPKLSTTFCLPWPTWLLDRLCCTSFPCAFIIAPSIKCSNIPCANWIAPIISIASSSYANWFAFILQQESKFSTQSTPYVPFFSLQRKILAFSKNLLKLSVSTFWFN